MAGAGAGRAEGRGEAYWEAERELLDGGEMRNQGGKKLWDAWKTQALLAEGPEGCGDRIRRRG